MPDLIRKRVLLDPRAFAGAANKFRTPGLHLTDIIQDVMRTIGVNRNAGGAFTEDMLAGYQLQGYLWEYVFHEGLRGKLMDTEGVALAIGDYAPLPEIAVSFDGKQAFTIDRDKSGRITVELPPGFPIGWLIMSPDGVRTDVLRLLELKHTTKSVNMQPERDKPEFFMQARGYLMGLSLIFGEWVSEVEWHCFFPCGDYTVAADTLRLTRFGVPESIYEIWQKTYAPAEIQDNFSMLVTHAIDRAAEPEHPWRRYIQ